MKYPLLVFVLFNLFFFSCKSPGRSVEAEPAEEENDDEEEFFDIELPPPGEPLKVSTFREVWGYVAAGSEDALRPGMPISDVGYCFADVGLYGKLVNVPDRRKLSAFPGRVHLVVKCDGGTRSHFVLKPGSPERIALVADLIAATRDYDGLQIDFEDVPQQEVQTYHTFLRELRNGLPDKMLTVAHRARSRKIDNDVYDYERTKPVVDRILIMAYDEHWSGSAPGSIASLAWCRRVADYSLKTIGGEKLIMGLPFYGRAWVDTGHARAYIYTSIQRVIRDNNVTDIQRENGIPTFSYDATVSVKAYYEDEYSLSTRMDMYKSMGVNAIGFWRVGQETRAVWDLMQLEK